MRKIYLLFAAAAAMVVACKPSEPVKTLALTPENVVITNDLEEDAVIAVNNTAKTIDITLAYADKAELAALGVKFEKLNDDFAAPAFTFDFSKGAAKTVTFTSGSTVVDYAVKAAADKPEPHFVALTLNGVAVASGTAKLNSTSNLKEVKVEFTVAPAGTKVLVGGKEVATGEAIDFSDKVNGVEFSLVCEDVTEKSVVKVVTTGISKITRVWGSYGTGKEGDILTPNNERNIAMDNEYIYLPNAGAAKVRAIKIADRSVTEMNVTGIAVGTHVTSGARVMDNGSGTVLLVHNLAIGNADGSAKLKVYAYDAVDAAPRTVLEYSVPNGVRLGDKMSVEGNWAAGKLMFFDYTNSADRAVYMFDVANGVVNASPKKVTLGDFVSGNVMGGIFKYSDSEYAFGGTAQKPVVFSVNGGVFTKTYVGDGDKYSAPAHDLTFFSVNEENYMAALTLRNQFADGTLRITYLANDTLAASLDAADTTKDKVLGIGSETGEEVTANPKDGNGTGGVAYRVINGKIHIAALASSIGVALFTIE